MTSQLHTQPGRSTRSAASTISYTRPQQPAGLARRLLFPHLPPGSDLPPLFVSPACPPELNDEAYDLLALALRAFVHAWWNKLTRYDKEVLPQITGIVTHVVRTLEQRVLNADLSLLLYGDIPALVTQHYRDYRQAAAKVSTSYAAGGALSLPQLFHQLQPHMAISSDGSIDEEYFRQVFDHILRECLPSEDYAPETERFIVREIALKVVLRDVIPLATKPWFLQKTLLDALGPLPDLLPEQPSVSSASHSRITKSSIIVLLLSAIQTLSGTCIMLIHAYKQVVHIIPVVNQTSYSQTRVPTPVTAAGDDAQYLSTTASVSSASSIPSAHMSESKVAVSVDLTRGPLELMSEVLDVRNRLAATALVQFVSLCCFSFQTFMNKLLYYLLYTHVLSASTMLSVVRLSKRTLFPNGYPGPTPVCPTAEEQGVMREQVVKRLTEWVPSVVRRVLLGDSAAVSTVEMVVDGLSDEPCNRHLALFVLDAVLLSLFPEMGSLF